MGGEPASPDLRGLGGRHRTFAGMALVLLLGGGLRFARLDETPPGLWFDEALNAQDALATARGGPWRLVYPDEFPREPLWVWMLAGATRLAGPELVALRATAAVVGLATTLALFLLVRDTAGGRVAVLAAAVLATLRWHVIFSRLLFRSLLLPLWLTLLVWCAVRARQLPSAPRAAILGALIGGGFYTYLAWFFMLPGVAALTVWPAAGRPRREAVRFSGVALVTAALVAAPILIHYARHPEHLTARPAAVSPLSEGLGPALGEIGGNLIEALGMFHIRGDHVPKHNLPWKPALDPLQGVFFLIGLVETLRRARRREPLGWILPLWLGLGLTPTILTRTDSPNFLRTLGVTPAVAVLVALGIEAGWRLAEPLATGRGIRVALAATAMAWVAASGVLTARDVFGRWGRDPVVWESFNGREAQLGRGAAETPAGVIFWAPAFLAAHRSFLYLAGEREVRPYENFDGLRPDGGSRWIAVTDHNAMRPVLERLAPGGHLRRELRRPDGRAWAWIYAVPEGALPDPAEVARAEAAHPVDVRW